MFDFTVPVQKFGGLPPPPKKKILEATNMLNLALFWTSFHFESE